MKWRFHTKQIDIEKLAAVMTSSVVDRLIVLSHTAARYMETDGWPEIVERVKRTEGSKRLLRAHLMPFLASLLILNCRLRSLWIWRRTLWKGYSDIAV